MVTSAEGRMKLISDKYLRQVPEFSIGDTVSMMIKAAEGDKVRLHPFEGLVIAKNGRGIHASFTVRKISFGEGVERVFPVHSPVIESIKVVSRGVVTHSKLYYLRNKSGKESRIKIQQ